MACPDPSLRGISLPRAHPCIAHYRPFTGAHNRTLPSGMAGSGGVRGTRAASGVDTNRSPGDALLGLRGGWPRRLPRARPVDFGPSAGGGDGVGGPAPQAGYRAADVQPGVHIHARARHRRRRLRRWAQGGARGCGARGAGHGVLLRPGPQGLRGHGHRHAVEGLVHGGGRSAVGRLRADHRQHERQHAAVHRHRRVHVHRPADAGHDLHGGGRPHRHGLHGDRDRRRARLPDRHHLHHRPGPRHRAHAHPAFRAARVRHQRGRPAPVRPAGRARQRQRRRRQPTTRAATPA